MSDNYNPEPGLTRAQEAARAINLTHAPAVLAQLGFRVLGNDFPVEGFLAYQDQLMESLGNPKDPLLRLLIQQMLWAHFAAGFLHVQSAAAETPETANCLSSAASRLTAEYRRSLLAIRDYRSAPVPAQVFVNQQNVATGDQQIAYIDPNKASATSGKTTSHSELEYHPPIQGLLPNAKEEISLVPQQIDARQDQRNKKKES